MVKKRKKHNKKELISKVFTDNCSEARKINVSTGYDACTKSAWQLYSFQFYKTHISIDTTV